MVSNFRVKCQAFAFHVLALKDQAPTNIKHYSIIKVDLHFLERVFEDSAHVVQFRLMKIGSRLNIQRQVLIISVA
jgi:hypothetical protein